MGNLVLYAVAIGLLLVSFSRDRTKTKQALRKAWKALDNILPQFLGVLALVGILLAVFDEAAISKVVGQESGWPGVVGSAIVGAVTLIPGFVAFPTAALLVENGAGYMQIGAFISALMMVGIVTLPVESQYFGGRLAIMRNLAGFVFSFVVAIVIGKVMSGS